MVRKVVCIFLALVFLVSFVSAQTYSSKIRVKTLPHHDVYLSIMDPANSDKAFIVLPNVSDQYGDAYFTFESDDTSKFFFDLRVKIKKGAKLIYPKEGKGEYFEEGYALGDEIEIKVGPEDYEFILTPGVDFEENDTEQFDNETEEIIEEIEEVVEEETVLETEEVPASTGTGFSISSIGTNPTLYGILIALFLGGGLTFFIMSRKQKRNIRVDLGASPKDGFSRGPVSNGELAKAEAKLKEAQREVQKIRNEEKIREARARIAAEEAELRKLRSGRV